MRYTALLCLFVLSVFASGAFANHKHPQCMMAEEILDEISPKVAQPLTLAKFDRDDALRYVELMFKFTGGGKPPFDLFKVKGGVVIYAKNHPVVYAGVVDGAHGEVCHAAVIPASLHRAILVEIEKGKS